MKKDDNEKPLYVSSSYVRRVADELGVQIESGKVYFWSLCFADVINFFSAGPAIGRGGDFTAARFD